MIARKMIIKVGYQVIRIKNLPRDIYNNIKYFIQRGLKGYSDRDLWSLDYHLSKVICGSLKELKEVKSGYPATYDSKTKKYDYNQKRWDDILDDMIIGFELLFLLCEDDYIASQWSNENKMSDKKFIKIYKDTDASCNKKFNMNIKTRVLTKKEENKIDKSFELFRKYFRNLWD